MPPQQRLGTVGLVDLPTLQARAGVTAMPSYLNERAATIYSGASEIQRDVLAKRVLVL